MRGKRLVRGAMLALTAAALLGAGGVEIEEGVALVIARDTAAGTVTLEGGRVYHVDVSTRISDANGRRIPLAQVPVAARRGGLHAFERRSTAHFEARRVAGRPTLRTLRLGQRIAE